MVVREKPYIEEQISQNTFIRTFYPDVIDKELVWHRDREDRIVEAIEDSDWLIQLDNQLPQKLSLGVKYHIPMGIYHRAIKGTGQLKVKVIKNPNI